MKPSAPPSVREGIRLWAPVALAAILVVAIAWPYVEPAPPNRVVIATSAEGSLYSQFAEKYARYFAQNGVELIIRHTHGGHENYDLLLGPKSDVDLAIVQGGTAPPVEQRKNLEAVCAISLEPLFVCYRHTLGAPELTKINDLAGKRLAIGKKGGGTRVVAEPLLNLHGILQSPGTVIVEESGPTAAAKLKSGEIDAAFFCTDVQTEYLLELLRAPEIRILNLANADVYTHKLDYVIPITLHAGAVDLKADIPDREVHTVAASTCIIARRHTHKAVIQLMVQAAHEAHDGMHPIADRNTFPSLQYCELPVGGDAQYYFNLKPSLLQRKLPFWMAQLLDRLLILIVPLLVVIIPMIRFAPMIYRWGVQRRIYRWYKRLRMLDERAMVSATPSQREIDRKEVEKLETEVAAVKVPLSYMEQLYQLRLHVAWVRDRLAGNGPVAEVAAAKA